MILPGVVSSGYGVRTSSSLRGFPLVEERVAPTSEASSFITSPYDDCGDGEGNDGEESGEGRLVDFEPSKLPPVDTISPLCLSEPIATMYPIAKPFGLCCEGGSGRTVVWLVWER